MIYLGLELGLFARIRAAGRDGITPAELASAAGCTTEPVDDLGPGGTRGRAHRPRRDADPPGRRRRRRSCSTTPGPSTSAGSSSLPSSRASTMPGWRTSSGPAGRSTSARRGSIGRSRRSPSRTSPSSSRRASRSCPSSPPRLAAGGRVLDVACGGGKWLIAVATRFPATELVGVEFEPDSVARAMRHVTDAGLDKRIRIEAREIPAMPYGAEFDLVYVQDALHELPDPVASLRGGLARRPARRSARRPRVVPAGDARGLADRSRPSSCGGSRSTSCSRARACTHTKAFTRCSPRRRCRRRSPWTSCRARRSSSWSGRRRPRDHRPLGQRPGA